MHTLRSHVVPCGNSVGTPAREEVELNHLALQIGPVVLYENRNLGWKRNPVGPDLPPQVIDSDSLKTLCNGRTAGIEDSVGRGWETSPMFEFDNLCRRLHKQWAKYAEKFIKKA